MRRLFATVALAGLACAGGESGTPEASAAEIQSATAAPVGAVESTADQAVHTVNMILTDAGEYRFEPAKLTIKAGDTVRWVNVSGGPHNVQFKGGIPDGAESVLSAAMEGRTIGPLSGSLLVTDGQTYEINFTGAPAGTYHYVCTPHELLGMVAELTVEN